MSEFLGTLPAWISTGSVAIAAMTYWYNSREKDRQQAAKIAAWLSDFENSDTQSITISNFSDSPAFEIRLTHADHILELAELSPRSYLVGPFGGPLVYYASGKELTDEIYMKQISDADKRRTISDADKRRTSKSNDRPVVAFKDAVGRKWTINASGRPKRQRSHS